MMLSKMNLALAAATIMSFVCRVECYAHSHAHASHPSFRGLSGRAHAQPRQQTVEGFQLLPNAYLEASHLGATCQQVLKQSIACDEYISELGDAVYHGSLGDKELTDRVCSGSCERSLTTTKRRIAGACASTPEYLPGRPLVSLVDAMVAGRNETCLKDPATGKYCNDLMDEWDEFEELAAMPREMLCSFCFGGKLRMMQASPYSGYDGLFQDQLEYVSQECGVKSPTEVLPPLTTINVTIPAVCSSGNVYVAREGDTCDGIARAHSVSAASLYYINANLRDCLNVEADTQLCLPEACERVHTVHEGETCAKVAVASGTSAQNLVAWNQGLGVGCAHFWSQDIFWGRVICVSPPGGDFDNNPGEEGGADPGDQTGGQGGSGDGYADVVVDVPKGKVADNTTVLCGEWIQAQEGVGCAQMILGSRAIPINLFLEVNPSLDSVDRCDANLLSGIWYCLRPYRYWEQGSNLLKPSRLA